METSKHSDSSEVVSVRPVIEVHSQDRTKIVYVRRKKRAEPVSYVPLPFDMANVPQGLRSKRKRKIIVKEALPRVKEKLDSRTFDVYLSKIWMSLPKDKKKSCTYFDCLWFVNYRKASSKEKVLSWIKKSNIFSKKYVFVPIVCWGHWNLLILCNFGESLQSTTRSRCMLLLDSLEMANPIEPEIRKFVLDIFKAVDRPETAHLISQIPFLVPKVPQQRDGNECGNFVLYFIKLFAELAPPNFSMEGYPYFMTKDWFIHEDFDRFFERLDSMN